MVTERFAIGGRNKSDFHLLRVIGKGLVSGYWKAFAFFVLKLYIAVHFDAVLKFMSSNSSMWDTIR